MPHQLPSQLLGKPEKLLDKTSAFVSSIDEILAGYNSIDEHMHSSMNITASAAVTRKVSLNEQMLQPDD